MVELSFKGTGEIARVTKGLGADHSIHGGGAMVLYFSPLWIRIRYPPPPRA